MAESRRHSAPIGLLHNLKQTILIILFMTPLVCFGTGYSDYRLGTGDQIKIQVFEEPDLSFEVRLSDAGTFSYPFLGELNVLGMTVGQLEEHISSGLLDGYLVDPKVYVSVIEYRPFYIHGEVEAPGGFPYQPGLTLRKAIALAGGFTERASRTKIFVLSEVSDDQSRRRISMEQTLSPGDIVTVEQSFF